MEAREFAEELKDFVEQRGLPTVGLAEARWGYGDADFFVETDGEGTFLVSVVKVAE